MAFSPREKEVFAHLFRWFRAQITGAWMGAKWCPDPPAHHLLPPPSTMTPRRVALAASFELHRFAASVGARMQGWDVTTTLRRDLILDVWVVDPDGAFWTLESLMNAS